MTTTTYSDKTPSSAPNSAPDSGPDSGPHAGRRPRRNLARLIAIETKFEFLKLLRVPVYSISVLAFPLMFYLVFGSFYGQFEAQGVMVSKYMVATFGAGGVLSADDLRPQRLPEARPPRRRGRLPAQGGASLAVGQRHQDRCGRWTRDRS